METQANSAQSDTRPLSESQPPKRVYARFIGGAIKAAGVDGHLLERDPAPKLRGAGHEHSHPRSTRGNWQADRRCCVDLRAPTLALFSQPEAALYSVQVARELNCSVSRASYYLRRLERDGVLVSRKELSPSSGNGRRIYQRCPSHALPARNVEQQTRIAS